MSRINGSLPYVIGAVVVALAALAIALKLAPDPNAASELTTVGGVAVVLINSFFASARAAADRKATKTAIEETKKAVVDTNVKVVETKNVIVETKGLAEATHANVELVRQEVDGKMTALKEEIRKSALAEGEKRATDKQLVDAAKVQATTDAAKVQVYEGQAAAAAQPVAALTVDALATHVARNTQRLEAILARLDQQATAPAASTTPLGTAEDPILTQEVTPADPRYRKPKS